MNRGWYTHILTDFNYKQSTKDIFLARVRDSDNEQATIFAESFKKKRKNNNEILSVFARHMILENLTTLIRCQGCKINQKRKVQFPLHISYI